MIKEKLEEKKQQRIQWYSDIGYGDYDKNKFKTKFLDKFLQNERERKEQEELDKKVWKYPISQNTLNNNLIYV